MDIRSFKTDDTKETEGVWQPVGDGAEILVARSGNPNAEKALRRLAGRYKGKALDLMPREKQRDIYTRIMAETILLDWRGFYDGDEPLPYSTETAYEKLREMRDFRELVQAYADDAEAYRERVIEDDAGN